MVPSCAEGGVLGILCASIAAEMGTEAIKLITGIGEPLLARLLIYDALVMSYRTVTVRKGPQSPPITAQVDYDEFCSTCGVPGSRELSTWRAGSLRGLSDSNPTCPATDGVSAHPTPTLAT